jgi:hypothetical protein
MSSRIPIDQSLDDSRFPMLMRVTKSFEGKFTKWKSGEVVRADKTGRYFSIRKLKMRGTRVPLAQSCCAVPSSLLESIK